MASLENRTGYWNIIFYFGGQRYVRSLKTKDEKEANDLASRLERRQRLVESGDLDMPAGVDVPTFLLTDGKLTIALVHLFFNVAGTILIYPVVQIRNIPLMAARKLADVAVASRKWALLYVVLLFYGLPAIFAVLNKFFG